MQGICVSALTKLFFPLKRTIGVETAISQPKPNLPKTNPEKAHIVSESALL